MNSFPVKISFKEINKKKNIVTYDNLLKNVRTEVDKINEELDDSSEEILLNDYYNNIELYKTIYTVNDLVHIAKYYDIYSRRKKKDQLVEEILLFENDFSNIDIVNRRKLMWDYMEEIRNDNYLRKFLIYK